MNIIYVVYCSISSNFLYLKMFLRWKSDRISFAVGCGVCAVLGLEILKRLEGCSSLQGHVCENRTVIKEYVRGL